MGLFDKLFSGKPKEMELGAPVAGEAVPIQEVKEVLGHEKIDTTMIYCNVLRDNVKLSHKKYVA